MPRGVPPGVMCISGSDPTAGAGAQNDLLTVESLGIPCATVITALTAQNTSEFISSYPVDPVSVKTQIRAVLKDMDIRSIKIGMLPNSDIIDTVIQELNHELKRREMEGLGIRVVMDPVLRSSSGFDLTDEKGIELIKNNLFPICSLITPNVREAAILTGMNIQNIDDALASGRLLLNMGSDQVLITGLIASGDSAEDTKGIHLNNEDPEYNGILYNVLVWGDGHFIYKESFLEGLDPHGTGCMLSSAISAFLSQGNNMKESVAEAISMVRRAVTYPKMYKKGYSVDPLVGLKNESLRYTLLQKVRRSVDELVHANIYSLIPEVASNFVVSLPYSMTTEEMAGIEGRIVRFKDRVHSHGPWFGVSDHVARFLLELRKFDPDVIASMNIKLVGNWGNICKELGLGVEYAPRSEEPKQTRNVEQNTMNWAAEYVMKGRKKAPDIIVDLGDVGKEPMIRVLGKSPEALVNTVLKFHGLWIKHKDNNS